MSDENLPPISSCEPVIFARESQAVGLAWERFRGFLVHRRETENVIGSICSFYLVPADNRPLPLFRPGQFPTFKLLHLYTSLFCVHVRKFMQHQAYQLNVQPDKLTRESKTEMKLLLEKLLGKL